MPTHARFDIDYLSKALTSIFQSQVTGVSCSDIQGDASDRRYFRISFQNNSDSEAIRSVILMQLKEPHPDMETDWIRMLKFLKDLDLPVPELFHYDIPNGLLFLEDGGTATLEDQIREHPEETPAYYRKAVEILARMHDQGTRKITPACPAYSLRFDVEKLMWEFDFMLVHYVAGLHKRSLSDRDIHEIRGHFEPLCRELEEQKPCFTHRDFHSRNLMASCGKLMLLDFQDARMGPCQYDLVSLVKDSYVQLDRQLRQELIDLYIRLKEQAENQPVDREEFLRVLDVMSIQRNLKAIGTFANQYMERGNDRYLQYIPPTLEYVRQTLNSRFAREPLGTILKQHIPGLNETEEYLIKPIT